MTQTHTGIPPASAEADAASFDPLVAMFAKMEDRCPPSAPPPRCAAFAADDAWSVDDREREDGIPGIIVCL
jgi:hypothetical protein